MSGVSVNLQADTPVERLAREMGERRIGEVGRTATLRERRREQERSQREAEGEAARAARGRATPGPATAGVAQETLIARRAHSKGDGNLPAAQPHPELFEERPEDRMPHDLPKERDDRSAPKGNVPRGQVERNRVFAATRPRTSSSARPKARRSSSAKRKVTTRPKPRVARAKTGVRKPASASLREPAKASGTRMKTPRERAKR